MASLQRLSVSARLLSPKPSQFSNSQIYPDYDQTVGHEVKHHLHLNINESP